MTDERSRDALPIPDQPFEGTLPFDAIKANARA